MLVKYLLKRKRPIPKNQPFSNIYFQIISLCLNVLKSDWRNRTRKKENLIIILVLLLLIILGKVAVRHYARYVHFRCHNFNGIQI